MMHKPTRKGRKKRVKVFIISALLAIVLLAYGGIAIFYQTHFFKNTTINEIGSSDMTADVAAALVEQQSFDYVLKIVGRDEQGQEEVIGSIYATDISLRYEDTLVSIEELLAEQDELLWITMFFGDYSYEVERGVTFDAQRLEDTIKAMDACQKENMIDPKNACISEYSADTKQYTIIPETMGTTLRMDKVLKCVEEAISQGESTVDLEEQGCYKTAAITAEDKNLLNCLDTANKWLQTEITYDWNGSQVIVDADVINEWIVFEKNEVVLKDEAVAEFVAENAREYDTYGKQRTFMTTSGEEVNLPSGAYGWKTDREGEAEELKKLVFMGSTTQKEPLYLNKGAEKGSDDIGSSYVEVDLTNQHLYLYQEGEMVLESDLVSGKMSRSDCVTPPGVFGLTYKTKNAVLRGDDYETPVSYWMPFNGNIGMHDATWRSAFGGSIYLTSGSHGCINLPIDKAAAIYDYVSTGFPVVCYYK